MVKANHLDNDIISNQATPTETPRSGEIQATQTPRSGEIQTTRTPHNGETLHNGKTLTRATPTPQIGEAITAPPGEEIRAKHHSNDLPTMRKHNSGRTASASIARSQGIFSTTAEQDKEISKTANLYNPPIRQSTSRRTYQTQLKSSSNQPEPTRTKKRSTIWSRI
jgi:hypothetical protein